MLMSICCQADVQAVLIIIPIFQLKSSQEGEGEGRDDQQGQRRVEAGTIAGPHHAEVDGIERQREAIEQVEGGSIGS